MGNTVKRILDKDTAFKTLEIINSWIIATDNKSSILLAFIGLVVGLSTKTYESIFNLLFDGTKIQFTLILVFFLIYVILLGLTVFHLANVFKARIKNQDIFPENLFSFIYISEIECKEYINKVRDVDEEGIIEMILSQISINSKITKIKMRHFNKALKLGLLLIPLTIILMFIVS